MAQAKLYSLSGSTLYIGKSGTAHSISATLDLSEIQNNSNYKYAYFVYIGTDRNGAFQSSSILSATSSTRTITISGGTNDTLATYLASDATKGKAWVEVVTYNSSGREIAHSKNSFEVILHEDCKPTVGSLHFNPANVGGRNILLTNYNTFGFKIGYTNQSTKGTEWKPTTGSRIVSYTISGPGMTTQTCLTNKGYYTYNHADGINISSSTTQGSGLQYTVTVTDARGRSNSYTKTYYNWYHYHKPQILSISVTRHEGRASSATSETGQYIQPHLDLKIASVSIDGTDINTNYSYKYYIDGIEDYYARPHVGDLKSHVLTVVVTDALGGQATKDYIVPAVERIINIRGDGTGIAFGTKAKNKNEFHCVWNINCDGTITSSHGTCTNSDVRLKTNIQDVDINILDSLRPVKYEFIQAPDNKTHFGFIAQEVVSALSNEGFDPESAGLLGYTTRENQQLYTLAYDEFIPLVVKKCQELQKENNEMRAEIAEIKQLLLQTSSE